MWANMRDFWKDETGMGTVEIILIMVVLIGLVIIFKKQFLEFLSSGDPRFLVDVRKMVLNGLF